MKDFLEKIEGVLCSLWSTVPYLTSFHMVDWLIFAISCTGILVTLKNRLPGLFLMSISGLFWAIYTLYEGELAQCLSFLIYFWITAWGCYLTWKHESR